MEDSEFSPYSFFKRLSATGQVSVIRCKACNSFVMPPTLACKNCLSRDLEWVPISQKGKLISFSEIHVSNAKFQKITPYIVGIIETVEGVRLPGRIVSCTLSELSVGAEVAIVVEDKPINDFVGYHYVLKGHDQAC